MTWETTNYIGISSDRSETTNYIQYLNILCRLTIGVVSWAQTTF